MAGKLIKAVLARRRAMKSKPKASGGGVAKKRRVVSPRGLRKMVRRRRGRRAVRRA
jgi:hypothetical protein